VTAEEFVGNRQAQSLYGAQFPSSPLLKTDHVGAANLLAQSIGWIHSELARLITHVITQNVPGVRLVGALHAEALFVVRQDKKKSVDPTPLRAAIQKTIAEALVDFPLRLRINIGADWLDASSRPSEPEPELPRYVKLVKIGIATHPTTPSGSIVEASEMFTVEGLRRHLANGDVVAADGPAPREPIEKFSEKAQSA